jgi:beta-galactosidase
MPLWGQSDSRTVRPFDEGWKFATGDYRNANKSSFNDRAWRTLNLPHDWSIEGENLENAPGGGNTGYFPTGIGWYRKTFDRPSLSPEKRISIEFDGVYENSEVWINGKYLGKRPGGYVSFAYDLTPYLKAKNNLVAVRVDNSRQPNSRWYTGSGIYRHVRLTETQAIHLERWGVFIYTQSLGEESAVLKIKATVVNDGKAPAGDILLKHTLRNRKGEEVASVQSALRLDEKERKESEQELTVLHPEVWSLEDPCLYTLTTVVYADGKESDCETNTTGIRTIQYTADKGFLLNGKQVKMKGVNLHHDAGATGAAVPERVWERRLEILQSGGCNAIRTAHNPPAPELLDICDRMGILVMDEAFDEWLAGKREYTYKLYFAQWYEEDLKAMVMRDRNHPSVVMWSIGNEIPDQSSAEGPALARQMIALCHSLDPTRLVTSGNDNIAADHNAATEEFLEAFANDIIGYNYPDRYHERRELLYSIDKALRPERRVVGTETGGIGGYRAAPVTASGEQPAVPAGRRRPGFPAQLIDVEQRWKYTLLNDYVIGDFMWTGIDYYGETFWPSRGAVSGYLDNCGFRKDGYYFFKSIWTDEPVLHLASDWNKDGQEGRVVQVICFTNCGEVELFVNGKSYGSKTFEFPRRGNSGSWNTYEPGKVFTSTADLHLTWDVIYEPGEIKAVGKKDGREYTFRQVTTGAPAKLKITADRDTIHALPSDVVHITVEITDRDGHRVPYADNLIKFEAPGAGILGVESGNMMDLSSVKATERKAWGGLCLAIIQADKAGSFTVKASSEGLGDAEAVIEVMK